MWLRGGPKHILRFPSAVSVSVPASSADSWSWGPPESARDWGWRGWDFSSWAKFRKRWVCHRWQWHYTQQTAATWLSGCWQAVSICSSSILDVDWYAHEGFGGHLSQYTGLLHFIIKSILNLFFSPWGHSTQINRGIFISTAVYITRPDCSIANIWGFPIWIRLTV